MSENHDRQAADQPEAPACCAFSRTLGRLSFRRFTTSRWALASVAAIAVGVAGYSYGQAKKEAKRVPDQVSGGRWVIHDLSRPKPPVVTPGTFPTADQKGTPPSDAVVLFDGKDLSKFKTGDGDAVWTIDDEGAMVVGGKGGVETREPIGDMQLHVEWASPKEVKGEGQGRGNSGLYIMGRYEVQVLDSFENETYADGGATAIYGQNPPMVNASKKPGEWQTYDIVFRGPRFDADGKVTREATVTVFHNGVLTQDHYRLTGGSGHYQQPKYSKHPEKLPLSIQNHGNPVRYRSIWYRPLQDLGDRNNVVDWKEDQQPAAVDPAK